jgi:hypothetical protein
VPDVRVQVVEPRADGAGDGDGVPRKDAVSVAGTEHALRRKCSLWLTGEMRQYRLWFIKLSGSRFQRVGAPDYVICVAGKFLAVELKADDETVSLAQARELNSISKAGSGATYVCRSLEALQDAIQATRTKDL